MVEATLNPENHLRLRASSKRSQILHQCTTYLIYTIVKANLTLTAYGSFSSILLIITESVTKVPYNTYNTST